MRPDKAAEGSRDEIVSKGADAPSAPEAAPPPKRGVWKSFFWPLVCLFQVGLIVGTLQFGSLWTAPSASFPSDSIAPEPQPLADDWKKENPEPEKARAVRGELDDVDRLIRAGRYELALVLCRSFSERAIAELRDAFQYRQGLCLEGLGRWDDALSSYRQLASRTPSARVSALAALGQARVWLRMRRPAESLALLSDILRRSALPALQGQPFLADARYFVALAEPNELLPNEPAGPLNDAPVSPLAADWSLDRALDWDRTNRASEAEMPNNAEIVEFRPGGEGAVRIFVAQMAATSLLDRLAERAGLRIEWSAGARRQVEDRSLIVALKGTPLPDALHLLIEPLGLVWTIKDHKLMVSSEEEESADTLKSRRLNNVRRSLRDALRAFPRHPLTPAAYLVLGNLEAVAGRFEEAAAWYVRIMREWPRSPLVVEAHYNLGLLRLRQGDRAAARQAFYRVVDRAPGHELAPLAYWRIGRIYLEEGEVEQALSPLRRALHTGPGSSAQAAAVLSLVAAYLLTENPRAANAILREHRELVSRDSYRSLAAFLDSLARFRAVADRRQRQREAGDLLGVLLTVKEDPLLGPEGLALVGQAYRELGMPEQMTRFYQKALEKLHGTLASQLTLELAEEYWEAEKPELALPLYRKLMAQASRKEAKRAQLRLAEAALLEKKPQDCLKFCREILKEKAEVDVPAVLRLMARAYEQTGEQEKAIRCLSGQPP